MRSEERGEEVFHHCSFPLSVPPSSLYSWFFFLRASSFVLSCLFKTYRETITIVKIYLSVLQMNRVFQTRACVCTCSARVMHVRPRHVYYISYNKIFY